MRQITIKIATSMLVLLSMMLAAEPMPAKPALPTLDHLKQEQQWREIRLQQAIANGDVSKEEADKIRQKWLKQAELIEKWQKGTLSPEERLQVEKALEKRKKRWERRARYDQEKGGSPPDHPVRSGRHPKPFDRPEWPQ